MATEYNVCLACRDTYVAEPGEEVPLIVRVPHPGRYHVKITIDGTTILDKTVNFETTEKTFPIIAPDVPPGEVEHVYKVTTVVEPVGVPITPPALPLLAAGTIVAGLAALAIIKPRRR